MFKIRGADGKEYGPVNGDGLRQWIAEGRVTAQTLIQAAGSSEWQPLASFPEFSNVPVAPRPGATSALPSTAAPKTCGLAIASLACGVLGCLGITALAGLVMGVVALVKINKSKGQLGGQGLAIGGICVSGVMLFMAIPFMAALLLPAFARARGKATTINCVSNMKQVGLAIRLYAVDHNDTLPPAATWCDAIMPSLGSPQALVCRSDNSGPRCNYGFNAKLAGLKEDQINPQTVLIFECKGGWNVNGGPADMVTRHGGTYTVGFADGSVRQMPQSQVAQLRWDP